MQQGGPPRSRPYPPATPAQVISTLEHLIATNMRAQQEMAQRLDLNLTDLMCFTCVLKAGDNLLTAGDLAEHARVTTGAVTGILNRLERAGYVTRRPDPTDRRRVRIAAQPAAVTRVLALYEPHYARQTELLAGYTPAEVAVLQDWFTRSGRLTSDYLEELRERNQASEKTT